MSSYPDMVSRGGECYRSSVRMMDVCSCIYLLAENEHLPAQMIVRIDGTCIPLWLWYVTSCPSVVLILMHYCRQLSQDDATRRELARSYRRSLGIFGPKREPSLDIHPDLMPIIDTVVLTFVYVEKLRMDKEERRKRAAASGGGP